MQAKLIVVSGDVGTAEIPLKLPATIGRSRDTTLTLPHPLVSRHHCELFEQDGRLMVRDLGSRNGTFVGNERIAEATFLPSGELLTIGSVTFKARYTDAPATSKTSTRALDTAREQPTVKSVRDALDDNAIPLTESVLFREDDLADDSLGVDSGHFGDWDSDVHKTL